MSKTQGSRSVPKVATGMPNKDDRDDFPAWLKETPDVDYEISAWSEHFASADVQKIGISREEYRTLKEVIASMRGVYGPAERKQVLDCLRQKFDEAKTAEAA